MEMQTLLASAVVASSMLAATAAGAEVLDFSWAGSGALGGATADWTQPSNPTPASYDVDATQINVTNGTSTFGHFSFVNFYTTASSGGFTVGGGTAAIGVIGPQLFNGTVAAPIFSTDVYTLGSSTLTVTAPIPGPSTSAMLLLGFAGLGALYRKRAVIAATFTPKPPKPQAH